MSTKISAIAAIAVGVMSVVTAPTSATAAKFKETFDYIPAPNPAPAKWQDSVLRQQDWCGGNAGDQFCKNVVGQNQKPGGGEQNDGGEGAISVSNGSDGNAGFAFWSQKRIGADSFLYTNKHIFAAELDTKVSYLARHSGNRRGAADPMHFALLIGNDWYISDDVDDEVSSTQRSVEFLLGDLTWFKRSTGGNPSVLPGGGVGIDGLALPVVQQVEAFGFWWNGPKR